MTKISIIIPMYNVEKYIEKCVYSTFNQGLTENDFEIIAVNDESPDNSLELVKELAKKHSNITIISQKNKGLGGARNTGIKHARGKYLLFLDADDYYIKETLKPIVKLSQTMDLDILEFGGLHIDTRENVVSNVKFRNSKNIYKGINYYNTQKTVNSACNKLYKKDFLLKNNLLFTENIYGEDFEFNTKALFYAEKVMSTNLIVSMFLQSENSITRNSDIKKKEKYLNDLTIILRQINTFKQFYGDDNNKEHEKFFLKRMTVINIDIFYLMFKNNFSIVKILKMKEILENNNIFCVSSKTGNIKKDLFKIVLLNFNFFFLKKLVVFRKKIKVSNTSI